MTRLDREVDTPVPTVALMGEFSAGKSTLVNLLVGADLVPMSVLTCTALPTLFVYGEELAATAVGATGWRDPVAPEDLAEVVAGKTFGPSGSPAWIEVAVPAERLRRMRVMDTPGLSDPSGNPESVYDAVESAHMACWCTLATQAWRASEARAWVSVPPRVRRRSALVLTHSDALNTEHDKLRVMRRMAEEAGPLFASIHMVSLLAARRALAPDGALLDEAAWDRSGVGELMESLDQLASRVAITGPRMGAAALIDITNGEDEPSPGRPRRPTRPGRPAPPPRPGSRPSPPKPLRVAGTRPAHRSGTPIRLDAEVVAIAQRWARCREQLEAKFETTTDPLKLVSAAAAGFEDLRAVANAAVGKAAALAPWLPDEPELRAVVDTTGDIATTRRHLARVIEQLAVELDDVLLNPKRTRKPGSDAGS